MDKTSKESLIRHIVQALEEINVFEGLDDEANKVKCHPPASKQEIEKLKQALPFALPPSYIQLLSIHNGIENFYRINGKILSASHRLQYSYDHEDWERPNLLFIAMDDSWNAVALDSMTLDAEGEMEVQEFDRNVETTRWSSLDEFLEGYSERLREYLQNARADRAQMDDDDE